MSEEQRKTGWSCILSVGPCVCFATQVEGAALGYVEAQLNLAWVYEAAAEHAYVLSTMRHLDTTAARCEAHGGWVPGWVGKNRTANSK